jgi:hypothetical protein
VSWIARTWSNSPALKPVTLLISSLDESDRHLDESDRRSPVSECAIEDSDEDSNWEDDESDEEADGTSPMDESYAFPRVDPQPRLISQLSQLTMQIRTAPKSIPEISRPKSPRTNRQEMMKAELADSTREFMLKERKSKNLQAPKSNDVDDTNFWSHDVDDDGLQGW